MTLIPYAYSVQFSSRYTWHVFPTCEAAVGWLIKEGYSPARCLESSPVWAHVLGQDQGEEPLGVSLATFIETVPVDDAAVRAELTQKVEDSRVQFLKDYPDGVRPARRFSGEFTYLCEYRPDELDWVLKQEMHKRSIRWKGQVAS